MIIVITITEPQEVIEPSEVDVSMAESPAYTLDSASGDHVEVLNLLTVENLSLLNVRGYYYTL